MDIRDYRDALQALDRRMDDIMEDADYIDSAILDPAYGEDAEAEEFFRKGMLGYIRQYLESLKRGIARAEEAFAELEETEKAMKEEADGKDD